MVVYNTLTFQHDNRPITINVRRSTKPEWVAESDNFPGWSIRAATIDDLMLNLHLEIPERLGEVALASG